ncbi:MAG: hypothetical protein ABIF01_02225 [Candidatus Micrarchaeota archaeon]
MVGTLQFLAIVTLIIMFIGATIVGLLGVVPVWSDVLMARSPRDLGINYTKSDYESGLAKIPGHVITNPEGACLTCNYSSSGTVPVDAVITQEEFTAQLNKLNEKNGPARDIQVKISNEILELSCFINDPGVNAPIYVKGKIERVSPKEVKVLVQYLEMGRIGIPFGLAQQPANEVIVEFFRKNPGLSIERLNLTNEGIEFKGTFPREIVGEP